MNWKKLSHLNAERIRKLQDRKLKSFIRNQIWPYHPYYRRLFKKLDIDAYSIKATSDLKKIPFTTRKDIAPTEKTPKKHIEFILHPTENLVKRYSHKKYYAFFGKKLLRNIIQKEYKPIHIHFTTGRTGLPVPFLYSSQDISKLKEAGRRLFEVFNVKSNDILVNAFPYAPHLAFWQTAYASNVVYLLSLHSGGGRILGTEKIISSIKRMRASVLTATPSYAYHLIKKASENKQDLSSLKHIILGGERVPQGLREKITELLSRDINVQSTYAFTEGKVAWPECSPDSGYHLYPDMEFIEIIRDDELANEYEQGEIVYTSLDWRTSTLLRYKTGDMGSISYEACPHCGRTVPRINAKIDRKADYKSFNLTKVKGTLVNLNSLSDILMASKFIDEWQLVIKKRNDDPYDVDELLLYISPKKGISYAKLKISLASLIREEIEISVKIIIMGKEELLGRLGMETELKEKRIIDLRKS